jgi:hypothetical protein
MHAEGRRLEHQLGRPVKATGEIKQWAIEATRDDPRASDSQIVRMIFDKFGVNIGYSPANRIRHLRKFQFLPPRRCQARRQFLFRSEQLQLTGGSTAHIPEENSADHLPEGMFEGDLPRSFGELARI